MEMLNVLGNLNTTNKVHDTRGSGQAMTATASHFTAALCAHVTMKAHNLERQTAGGVYFIRDFQVGSTICQHTVRQTLGN